MSLRAKAAITGFAEMKPQKGSGGNTPLGIIAEVTQRAIHDAGLRRAQIDGLLTGWAAADFSALWPSAVAEYLKLQPRYLDQVELGGASAAGMVWRAAAAIDAGMCNTVLCTLADCWDSRMLKELPLQLPHNEWEFEAPYGMVPSSGNVGYALITRRHMHEFGTTPEQLAKVAVDQRTSACKNSDALFGTKAIGIADVLNSPMILDPLHLLEIVSPCTGGAAIIVTSSDRVGEAPHGPVFLLGAGEAGGHSSIVHAESLTTSLIEPAARGAFLMAGVQVHEIDLVQTYDCYTATVIITLEDAGFCAKGEGGPFVETHDLSYCGDFPCNTNGGMLSFGQPGLAGGMSLVVEATRQLMGRAGARQVPGASLCYVNGNGGIMGDECSLILGNRN